MLHTYPPDYKVVFVGDASMSPYEISMPGGSVEHWNDEAGRVWLERLLGHFQQAVWLNPVRRRALGLHAFDRLMRRCSASACSRSRGGLDAAMRELAR